MEQPSRRRTRWCGDGRKNDNQKCNCRKDTTIIADRINRFACITFSWVQFGLSNRRVSHPGIWLEDEPNMHEHVEQIMQEISFQRRQYIPLCGSNQPTTICRRWIRYLNDSNQDQLLKWMTGKRIRNFATARLLALYEATQCKRANLLCVKWVLLACWERISLLTSERECVWDWVGF